MSRYIVIGAGAIGASTAAGLHEAGRDVVLIARGEHLAVLRERGLKYVRPDGTRIVRLPVSAGPAEVELRVDDVLILATKTQDSEAALQQWAWQPVTGAGAAAEQLPIVLLQNGLENARLALRRFSTVLDASILVPGTYLQPGEVVSPAAPNLGAIYLGVPPGGATPRADLVADDLRAAGYLVQIVPDIGRWKAGKLLSNLAYNLDALYGPSALRDAASAALRAEGHRVLTAAGIDIADPRTDGGLDLDSVAGRPIAGREFGASSTWQSLARAGSHESDYLNGEIVLLARLHGVAAPLNRAVQLRLARAAREGTAPGSLGDADLADTLPELPASRMPVLVDPTRLSTELSGDSPPLLLDVRWALGDADGRGHYRAGHIPSAVFVDLDTELADPPAPLAGRHPLPALDRLQAAARGWGLTAGRSVVVYDDNGGLSAARAWWLLRWAGHADVRILDGALAAWVSAGFDVETGTNVLPAGDVTLDSGQLPVVDADETAALALDGLLLDARAPERFRGEVEPIDPRAGHIPGAVSAPTSENLDAAGRFLAADRLRHRFDAIQAAAGRGGRVAVYCGSGVTAAHEIAALAVAGIDAALYPGSWSAWSSDPDRPVATLATVP